MHARQVFVLQTNYLCKLSLLWNLLCGIIFQNLLWNQLWMSFFTAKNGTNNDNMINNKVYPVIIYFHFQYYSDTRVSLIKSCIRRVKPNCLKDPPTVLKPMYDVTKMEFFCNTKDRTSLLCQSNIAHDFFRPRCSDNFVGKTARTFHWRTRQHAWTYKDSAVNNHLDECDDTKHIFGFCHLIP